VTKVSNFENSRWRTAIALKNRYRSIEHSSENLQIFMKSSVL